MDLKSYKISITGAVQGVGFRPYIYSLALFLRLKGEVYNDSEGVKIFINSTEGELANFIDKIYKNLPPLAKITSLNFHQIDDKNYTDFSITASKNTTKNATILPDFAICDDCKREFYDPKNPRFHYPFINCTNCGPRLSIIKNLPYDRVSTTMAEFEMCEFCSEEYSNPLNRRYHAQPISCPKCGPKFMLKNIEGEILCSGDESIKVAANLIKDGKIIAVKGMGGFHIVCDALNEKAVSLLRIRKNRPSKPFAIMCKDITMAKNFASISPKEGEILDSNIKSIVILSIKNSAKNSLKLVAPNLNKIGIFLPNTGLHLLLFEELNSPIIATSANLSGEPIIYNSKNIEKKLKKVVDFYLDNNREIITPSDDSICFIAQNRAFYLRTSRGLNPRTILSDFKIKGTFLALGAEMKSQFAIYHDSQIFISPYIGDLKNIATFDRFFSLLDIFLKTYELKFDKIIADLHPNFIHTKQFGDDEIVRFQHHFSHLVSVLAENSLLKNKRKFLGFCFDGTGYGDDGKIWGGEVLVFDEFGYDRVAKFDEFSLIGGENSIKNIYKLAVSIIYKYDLEDFATEFLSNFTASELKNLKNLEKNAIKTTSLGRIFDAFCAVIFGKFDVSYDGEAGMMIENFYDEELEYSYKFEFIDGVINFKNAFKSALKDDPKYASTGLINAISNFMLKYATKMQMPVVLGGGVFQNSTLLKKVIENFQKNEVEFYAASHTPTNDSGVAYGELMAYLSRLERENG